MNNKVVTTSSLTIKTSSKLEKKSAKLLDSIEETGKNGGEPNGYEEFS